MSVTRLLFLLLAALVTMQVYAGIEPQNPCFDHFSSDKISGTLTSPPVLDSNDYLHSNPMEVPEVKEWEVVTSIFTGNLSSTAPESVSLSGVPLYLMLCRFITPSLGSTDIIFPFHFFP
ncbi:hypothetical protein [Zeaxanthinibacter enoshimensis]|uniref:Uncharacterized protein n=1 Tax=Zeaxanthinibacter enoshimensis TaxID=392009 RepID=A0A4R6TKD6_9FLAO|nr:hypothetical protein [Zeaxanthinibacter enoshimensis]TDQ31107.1 hypothetical protein CLV82_1809 [Zeaxanthinibacter enoshimensis]